MSRGWRISTSARWSGRTEATRADDLRERHSDIVWRLRWRGGGRGWFYVYLLLEFQSTPNPFMAVRLLGYVALLLSGLVRTGVATPSRGLPAVLPLAALQRQARLERAGRPGKPVSGVSTGCERYQPQLSYLLVDENRLRPEETALPGSRVCSDFFSGC